MKKNDPKEKSFVDMNTFSKIPDAELLTHKFHEATEDSNFHSKTSKPHPPPSKWLLRLKEELSLGSVFNNWSSKEWEKYLTKRRILSDNYDTVISLDWPHFCSGATVGCGGDKGWCYTLGGQLGGSLKRSHKAAITDRLARDHPKLFSEIVGAEVDQLVKSGRLPYPNIRFSGSGEVHNSHFPALISLTERGIHLWGFSRQIHVAIRLSEAGISVLFSYDATTSDQIMVKALKSGLKLAYTSMGVDDRPHYDALVIFPLHRSGQIKEVVKSSEVCPKILEEYIEGRRRRGACQFNCTRCHMVSS